MTKIGGAGIRRLAIATAGAALLVAGSAVSALADDAHPFARYLGTWKGSGRIESVKGEERPMRCTATCDDSEGGKALAQSIRCEGPNFKFQVENYIVANGNDVIGNWRELTQQVTGSVTGQIQGNLFVGKISAPAVTASVLMRADQRSQALRIVPQGVEIAKIEIVMKHD